MSHIIYYIKSLLFFVVLILLYTVQLNAQCKVKIVVPRTNICLGDTLTMHALGGARSVLVEHFNQGNIGNQLINSHPNYFTQECEPGLTAGDYLWFGTQGNGPFSLTTTSLNIVSPVTINFDMRYGEDGAGGACDGPSSLSEAVHLQYSINSGATWVDIQVWDPNGGHDPDLTIWKSYNVVIPVAASTNNTQIRWIQNSNIPMNTANWGIDNINITGPGFSSYQWSDGELTQYHSDINPYSYIAYSVVTSGYGNSCSDTIGIYPVPRPSATFSISGNQCKNEPVIFTYTGNAPTTSTYNWQFPSSSNSTGSGQGPMTAQWSKTGSYYPILTVTSDGCSSNPFKKEVKINPLISFFMDESFGCEPLTVNYKGNAYPQNSTYYWDFGDGGFSNDSTPTYTYQNAGKFTLTVILESPQGCRDTMSFKELINCYPSPDIDFIWTPQIIPFSNPIATFINETQGGNTCYWSFGDQSHSSIWDPTHTYSSLGDYPVQLISTSSKGCVDSLSKILKVVEDRFSAPNIITPNGDGINDYFKVENLGSLISCKLEVYNRWGQLVYSNAEYDNLWDGDNLADGTYFYQVSYTSFFGEGEFKGALSIMGK